MFPLVVVGMSILAAIVFLAAALWIKSLNLSKTFYWRLFVLILGCVLVVFTSCSYSFHASSPDLRFMGVTKSGPYRNDEVPYRQTQLQIDPATGIRPEKRTLLTKYYDAARLPSTLILVTTRDDSSWGRTRETGNRRFEDFLSMISRQRLEPSDISLGLFTTSASAVERYTELVANNDIPIASIQIVFTPNADLGSGPEGLKRSGSLRNVLTTETLKDQKHVVWVEPDVDLLPDGLFDRFYEISRAPISDFDIANVPGWGKHDLLPLGVATVMCQQTKYSNLARNGWSGPSKAELRHAQENYRKDSNHLKSWPVPMSHLIEGTSDDTLVRLDGVGETVLYIRAELIRKGLKWPEDDKKSSERLCASAKELGWGCYGLGGSWETTHSEM
ncbi:hypothetical protein ABW21_db0209208 [Orbilia brochopaga]|nr:hypothetical protein ABW21_db0209208 [Drechslerella brochopaga]